jgi:hypothetical protein
MFAENSGFCWPWLLPQVNAATAALLFYPNKQF